MFMPMVQGGISLAGGHIIQGSGLFDGSSGYLTHIIGSTTNQKTFTIDIVFKLSDVGVAATLYSSTTRANDSDRFLIQMQADNTLFVGNLLSGAYTMRKISTQLFRDPSGYGVITVKNDTTQATAADRQTIYYNGVEITDWSTDTDWTSQNALAHVNTSGRTENIGCWSGTSIPVEEIDGYVARAILIDGQALDPTSFGEVTDDGFWQINDASGLTFGTNGFLIEGGSAMSAGTDSSGNSNNFSKSGTITATSDSPTNGGDDDEYGNYCTWNPLDNSPSYLNTYSEGNLKVVSKSGNAFMRSSPTMFVGSGKYYAEIKFTANAVNGSIGFLSSAAGHRSANNDGLGYENTGALAYGADGRTLVNGSLTATGGTTFTTNDVMMLALDMDNHDVYIGKNGTWLFSGVPDESTGAFYSDGILLSDEWGFACNGYGNPVGAYVTNFGASTFAYPQGATYNTEGFLSLSTANLSAPAVVNYEDEYYIEAGISHSNGSTTAVTLPKSVSGGAMVRIKRTDSTSDWYVFDTVRGANKSINWNDAAVEDTSTFDDQNLTGTTFTIPSDMATGTYLLECFYMGSYFQIKAYTGTGSAHAETYSAALDTAPGFMMTITRTTTSGPTVYHSALGATKYLRTDSAAAAVDSASRWNDVEPTTTQFTVGTSDPTNADGVTIISYHWANSGVYSFGFYLGNANSDGPVSILNGSPATSIRKNAATADQWFLLSTVLQDYNDSLPDFLRPAGTFAVATTSEVQMDRLSNGTKTRASTVELNGSTNQIITMDFGIQPMTDGSVNQGRAR